MQEFRNTIFSSIFLSFEKCANISLETAVVLETSQNEKAPTVTTYPAHLPQLLSMMIYMHQPLPPHYHWLIHQRQVYKTFLDQHHCLEFWHQNQLTRKGLCSSFPQQHGRLIQTPFQAVRGRPDQDEWVQWSRSWKWSFLAGLCLLAAPWCFLARRWLPVQFVQCQSFCSKCQLFSMQCPGKEDFSYKRISCLIWQDIFMSQTTTTTTTITKTTLH